MDRRPLFDSESRARKSMPSTPRVSSAVCRSRPVSSSFDFLHSRLAAHPWSLIPTSDACAVTVDFALFLEECGCVLGRLVHQETHLRVGWFQVWPESVAGSSSVVVGPIENIVFERRLVRSASSHFI